MVVVTAMLQLLALRHTVIQISQISFALAAH